MHARLAVTGVLLALATCANAGLDEGKSAHDRSDYTTAINEFRPLAEQGNAAAQFYLGWMYALGQGVQKDNTKAVFWYRKVADHGNAQAQYVVGLAHARGQGAAKDSVEAAKWFRKAADQGHSLAQFELGSMYARGDGVAKDWVEAENLYRKAAAQGHKLAKFALDIVVKAKGVNFSVVMGDGEEFTNMDLAYGRIYLAYATSEIQRIRGDADGGNAQAQLELGAMYERGLGVEKDDAEAVDWYRKAADQGNAIAQFNLGNMYSRGQGVARDAAEAVKWYRKAADQGDPAAREILRKPAMR